MGIGDWGLGIGPNPKSPIPNPQTSLKFYEIKGIMKNPRQIELEIRADSERDRQENAVNNTVIRKNFEVPFNLKKTFWCSFTLLILGAALIIMGFFEEVYGKIPGEGISFWVLGSILLIPGGYYSYQFYRAMKANDEEERDDILDEIPQI